MKLAMLRVDDALPRAGLRGRMLLQVHDELVLECPEEELEKTAKLVVEEMSSAYKLKVPLQTDVSAGKHWGVMEEVKV
jgi:DNA polymerase-1